MTAGVWDDKDDVDEESDADEVEAEDDWDDPRL